MVKISLILWVLALWGVCGVNSASRNAPPPAQDCSTVVLSMTDCLSFVTSGSTVKKPEGGCCAGLKSVLKTAPDCLCETFKNSGQLGIALNMTKAMTLPSACGVKAPPLDNCGISVAPGASPSAHSPKSSAPPKSHKTTPTPSEAPSAEGSAGGISSTAPAAAPVKSAASTMSVSLVGLVGVVAALSSLF